MCQSQTAAICIMLCQLYLERCLFYTLVCVCLSMHENMGVHLLVRPFPRPLPSTGLVSVWLLHSFAGPRIGWQLEFKWTLCGFSPLCKVGYPNGNSKWYMCMNSHGIMSIMCKGFTVCNSMAAALLNPQNVLNLVNYLLWFMWCCCVGEVQFDCAGEITALP